MKIKKIILLTIAAVIVAMTVSAVGSLGGSEEYLKSAVYLDEAVVLPENEGKLVIISGKVEMTAPAYDNEYGITIQSPNAIRITEKYSRTIKSSDDDDDSEYEWDWRSSGMNTELVGAAKLGEFELDAEVVQFFPNASDYDDFDSKEVARYSVYTELGGVTHVVVKGSSYASKTTSYRWGSEHEGDIAVYYRCLDLSKNSEMTLVGVQQGGKLIHGEQKLLTVNAGIRTVEELVSSHKNTMMIGVVFGLAIAAVCVFFALKSDKKKQKT